jgi:hypothetical protein
VQRLLIRTAYVCISCIIAIVMPFFGDMVRRTLNIRSEHFPIGEAGLFGCDELLTAVAVQAVTPANVSACQPPSMQACCCCSPTAAALVCAMQVGLVGSLTFYPL